VQPALIDSLPQLQIISVFGVGYDGVPIAHCRDKGIRVTNTPDVLTEDVADIATALVLMTSRCLAAAERFTRASSWPQAAFPLAHALRGKTAGIVGLGRIGKAIAHRLSAHGLKIAYHGRQPQDLPHQYCSSLIELAETSDFLIIACPGGPETRHLIQAEVLRALGPTGTLINIARGSVVDETALIEALKTGTIRAAGLDVFANEPHVPAELLACENAVLLPHVGSATNETRQAMAQLVIDNLSAHFAGQPLLTPVC
jgi:lactate dehydrogenase-like 2-hydroxyacid dehydrogenase